MGLTGFNQNRRKQAEQPVQDKTPEPVVSKPKAKKVKDEDS
jgi:hypothetical protein